MAPTRLRSALPVSPTKFTHVVFRTRRKDEMVASLYHRVQQGSA